MSNLRSSTFRTEPSQTHEQRRLELPEQRASADRFNETLQPNATLWAQRLRLPSRAVRDVTARHYVYKLKIDCTHFLGNTFIGPLPGKKAHRTSPQNSPRGHAHAHPLTAIPFMTTGHMKSRHDILYTIITLKLYELYRQPSIHLQFTLLMIVTLAPQKHSTHCF